MRRLLIALLLLSTFADAKTKLLMGWKNPQAPSGHFKNVLVIGISANPGRRSDFEDALSASLTEAGIQVTPGNQVLLRPDASPLDINYLREQVKHFKYDCIIVSRLVSVKESVTYVPPEAIAPYPYYGTFYGYYAWAAPIVYTPGYLDIEKTVRIETNVYAIVPPDGQLVWTGTSDTFNPKDAKKVIQGVVQLVTQELKKGDIL